LGHWITNGSLSADDVGLILAGLGLTQAKDATK